MGFLLDSASGRRWGKAASLGNRKKKVTKDDGCLFDDSQHSSGGKKWFGRLPSRARAHATSLGTAATADTLGSGEKGNAPFCPADDDGDRSGHPQKSGGGVESPLTAPKFLSEEEQATFDKFLASQGADQWRHLAGDGEVCLQNCDEEGRVSGAVQSSRRDSETGGLICKSNNKGSSSNGSPGKTDDDSDCFEPTISGNPDPVSKDIEGRLSAVPEPEQTSGCYDPSIDKRHSGLEYNRCSRRSASLSVSCRPCGRSRRSAPSSVSRHSWSCTGHKQSHRSNEPHRATVCKETSINEPESQGNEHCCPALVSPKQTSICNETFIDECPFRSKENSLSASCRSSSGVRPNPSHRDCEPHGAQGKQSQGKERRHPRHSPSPSVPRRPSSSSVSTLSMSSTDDESQTRKRRSQSHSRSRYSWMVPSLRRSRSRKAKEPTAAAAIADPQGRCPRHPIVWLRRRSALTGEWRVLQESCPMCAAVNDSAACDLGAFGSSPNVVAQGQNARLRSRSHSLSMSRKYRAGRTGEIGGNVGDSMSVDSPLSASAAFSKAAAELQKARLRSRSHSCSRPRHCPVDTDYHVDKAPGDAEKEEEASSTDGPMMWVSFQTPEDADDASASANDLSEALAMIEDVQSENASLHQSVAEVTQLAQGMGEKLADLVRVHETSAKDYEERLVRVKEGSGRKGGDLLAKLDAAREENKVLHAALVTGEEDMREWIRLMEEKERAHREDVERATLEQDALRQEIRTLRQALEKSTGRGIESAQSFNEDEGAGLMNDSFEKVWRAADETSIL